MATRFSNFLSVQHCLLVVVAPQVMVVNFALLAISQITLCVKAIRLKTLCLKACLLTAGKKKDLKLRLVRIPDREKDLC